MVFLSGLEKVEVFGGEVEDDGSADFEFLLQRAGALPAQAFADLDHVLRAVGRGAHTVDDAAAQSGGCTRG